MIFFVLFFLVFLMNFHVCIMKCLFLVSFFENNFFNGNSGKINFSILTHQFSVFWNEMNFFASIHFWICQNFGWSQACSDCFTKILTDESVFCLGTWSLGWASLHWWCRSRGCGGWGGSCWWSGWINFHLLLLFRLLLGLLFSLLLLLLGLLSALGWCLSGGTAFGWLLRLFSAALAGINSTMMVRWNVTGIVNLWKWINISGRD